MYGASKDFYANGARWGGGPSPITQRRPSTNNQYHLGILMALMCCSRLLGTSFGRQTIHGQFHPENSLRLKGSYDTLTSFLKKHDVGRLRGGNAGVFVGADVRQYVFDHSTSCEFNSGRVIEELKTTSPRAGYCSCREQDFFYFFWFGFPFVFFLFVWSTVMTMASI
jgi:hypothetical protein